MKHTNAAPTPRNDPTSFGTAGVWVALTGLLTAFGVDPTKAAAIGGFVSAVTPYVITFGVRLWGRRTPAPAQGGFVTVAVVLASSVAVLVGTSVVLGGWVGILVIVALILTIVWFVRHF